MKSTGIIRRVDDLGRIVLPKEVRRKIGISEGTAMEIFVSSDGITLKKYHPEYELEDMEKNLIEAVEDMCDDLGVGDCEEIMKNRPKGPICKEHDIKLAAEYWDDVETGRKCFELRKNDRGYKVGDILNMSEFKAGAETGRKLRAEITYMIEDYTGLEDGYCILAIKLKGEE